MNSRKFIQLVVIGIFISLSGCITPGPQYEPGPYDVTKPKHARVHYEQEPGITGGDIAGISGSYLVILRNSSLFSIRLEDASKDILRPISKIRTPPEDGYGLGQQQLFISEQRIVVIESSEIVNHVTVILFSINPSGQLKKLSTNYISTCYYYIFEKRLLFKSRMVNGRLILYIAAHSRGYKDKYPAVSCAEAPHGASGPFMMSYWNGQSIAKWRALVLPENIPFSPPSDKEDYAFHGIYNCDISKQYLSCKVKAIKGGFASSFYVSKKAIYLWVRYGKVINSKFLTKTLVYRFPINLEKNKPITVIEASGIVNDEHSEHSMYETKDGRFYAATDTPPLLHNVPISKFSSISSKIKKMAIIALSRDTIQNNVQHQFAGDYYAYGFYSSDKKEHSQAKNVYVVKLSSDQLTTIPLQHDIEGLKIVGKSLFVYGLDTTEANQDKSLSKPRLTAKKIWFSSILLSDPPQLKNSFVYDLAKNHPIKTNTKGQHTARNNLFYHQMSPKKGLLALPIQYSATDFKSYPYGAGQILFLQIDENLKFSQMGIINAVEQKQLVFTKERDDGTELMYENARPIFHGNRIFGLLGMTLVEITKDKSRIKELKRMNYFTHTYNP